MCCSAFWQKAAVHASVKVCLRKGKTERSDDKSVRNGPADTKVREEGWGGGDAAADSPAAYGKADIHTAAHGRPCSGAGGHALRELQPMESPCCKFFLRDLSTGERPTLEN